MLRLRTLTQLNTLRKGFNFVLGVFVSALLAMIRALIFLLVIGSGQAQAAVEIGLGMSSASSGRQIPALVGGFSGGSWLFTATSTGTRNDYSYFSNYSVSWFSTWSAGALMGAPLQAGFGAGLFYNERSFQDVGATAKDQDSEVGLGPAFFVRWNMVSSMYLNLELVWGLRNLTQHIGLNGQDLVTFSLGVEAW